jgi:hypothetical protein
VRNADRLRGEEAARAPNCIARPPIQTGRAKRADICSVHIELANARAYDRGMRVRLALPVLDSAFVCAGACSSPSHAQLPQRLNRCLPYPTYAQDVSDMRDEVSAKM